METGRIILLLWVGSICLSLGLYLDLPVLREDPKSAEALFVLWLSGLIFVGCVCDRNDYRVNKSEVGFLGFCLFCLVKSFFCGEGGYSGLFQFLFAVGLYFTIKQQVMRYGMLAVGYVSRLLVLMIIIQLVLCLKRCYLGEPFSHIYLPNTSLFGVVIATQLAFLVGAVYSARFGAWPAGKQLAIFPVAVMILGALLLMLTKGRSGWLGLIAAILALNMLSARNKRQLLRRLLLCMVFIVAFAAFLIRLKTDSSSGRMLVYKISFRMLKEHWLWGIGQGQFAKQYNLYQARYFESADIDNREALLADNVYYAFNDLLQLLVEQGLMGGLFFLLTVLLFLRRMRGVLHSGDNSTIFPFLAMLVCVSVSSSFIYSLHHLPVFLMAMGALAFCNARPGNEKVIIPGVVRQLARWSFIIPVLLFTVDSGKQYLVRRKVRTAGELARAGFTRNALLLYDELEERHVRDGKVLLDHAMLLYQSGLLSRASDIIEKAKDDFISNEVFLLAARVYAEMGNFPAAEMNYKTALYMVPNRMGSRYELMHFYFQSGDSARARYWAHSIAHMTVKVESEKTEMMKNEALVINKGRK